MTDDERTVLEWVVWDVTLGSLPAEVGEACLRLARTAAVPPPDGWQGDNPRWHITATPLPNSVCH